MNKTKPTVILYDGSDESLKKISKEIRNISCGTFIRTSFILKNNKILFYYRYEGEYDVDAYIRFYEVSIGQYIVQYTKYRPYVFDTLEEVNSMIKE